MLTDYWAHHYADDPKAAEDEVEDDEFDLTAIVEAMENDPDAWENL